ncbi:MAG: glycosyltransferase family 39 protein [Candidatus Aureabacteria bacterium]|nr:glycosyltransferase family 39 protein [Candidatus Auribacterota bacterium]
MVYAIFILIILFVSASAGRSVLGWLSLSSEERLRNFVLSAGIGLTLIIMMVSFLGSLSLLRTWSGHLVLLVLLLTGWKYIFLSMRSSPSMLKKIFRERHTITQWFLILALTAAVVVTLIPATAPPTGMDSLVYHLNLPKEFLKEGKIYQVPFDINALWPLNIEMLFTFGLMFFKNAVLAKMFNYLMGVLTIPCIYLISRKFASRTFSLAAAALYYLMPAVLSQSGYAYVDVGIAFFTSLLLLLVCEWMDDKKLNTAVLMGIFGGILLGAKFTNAIILATVAIMMLLWIFLEKKSLLPAVKPLFLFGVVMLIVSCHWYVRSYVLTGNPIFPFLNSLFGVESLREFKSSAASVGFKEFFITPFNLVLKPQLYGGVANQLGPALIAFFPLVILGLWKNPRAKVFFLGFVFYYIAWFFLKQNARFLLPAMVLFYPVAAAGHEAVFEKNRISGIIISVILGTIIFMFVSTAVYYARPSAALFFGGELSGEYLEKLEPTYGISRIVEETVPEYETVLIAGEIKRFYFNRKTIRADGLEYMSDYNAKVKSPEDMISFIRVIGIKYLVLGVYDADDGNKALTVANILRDKEFVDRYFSVEGGYEFKGEGRGVKYYLYKLKDFGEEK